MITFLILGILGLVLLLISFLIDGVLDIFDFDFGDGYLSLTSLATFMAAFGFSGVLAISGFEASTGVAVIAGLVVGALALLAAGGLTRYLKSDDGEGAPSSRTIVGLRGTVITGIAGPGSYGEVSLNHGGHIAKMGALADEAIPVGTSVQVITALSATSVKVSRVES